jgi:hypothetical protein
MFSEVGSILVKDIDANRRVFWIMSIAVGKGRRRSRDPSLRNSGKVPKSLTSSCKMVLRSWDLERRSYSMTATMDLENSDRLDVI